MPKVPNRELPPVATRLKELRNRRFLTQEMLAATSGVPLSTLKDIERGVVPWPQNRTIVALAAALEVTPQFLRFGED